MEYLADQQIFQPGGRVLLSPSGTHWPPRTWDFQTAHWRCSHTDLWAERESIVLREQEDGDLQKSPWTGRSDFEFNSAWNKGTLEKPKPNCAGPIQSKLLYEGWRRHKKGRRAAVWERCWSYICYLGVTWALPGVYISLTCNKDVTCFVTDGHLLCPFLSHHLGHHTQALPAEGKAWQIIPFINFVSRAVWFLLQLSHLDRSSNCLLLETSF